MNLFVDTICQRTCHALEELFPDGEWKTSEIKALIEQPPDAEMGDFALPCFSFSKKLRRSPKQIAEELENLLAPEPSEDQITDSENYCLFQDQGVWSLPQFFSRSRNPGSGTVALHFPEILYRGS
ncbi:MAG: hypothetical protein CM15mP66_00550 [Pseudomonadota bacterium]|nr:MAG: hypothetical protein CM15mP66_00550 [Pseudomonadota bacterium]